MVLNQQQYPLLMVSNSLGVLAIYLQSAPLESVFSMAGITITTERARLGPATTAELILFHDAMSAIYR
jgi:hypothetical protein